MSPQLCILNQTLQIIVIYTNIWVPPPWKNRGKKLAGHSTYLLLLLWLWLVTIYSTKVYYHLLHARHSGEQRVKAPAVVKFRFSQEYTGDKQMQIYNTRSSEEIYKVQWRARAGEVCSFRWGRRAGLGERQYLCRLKWSERENYLVRGRIFHAEGTSIKALGRQRAWCIWEQRGGQGGCCGFMKSYRRLPRPFRPRKNFRFYWVKWEAYGGFEQALCNSNDHYLVACRLYF